MVRWVARAIACFFRPRASLIAENLCLRQQLLVLQRRHPRPRLTDVDRRFWILVRRWFWGWREPLLIVKPETVIGWHRKGWRAYWRWRSRAPGNSGAAPDPRRAQIAHPTHGLGGTSCGVSEGSKPSWRGSDSRCRPEPLPSTCVFGMTEGHRPAGEPSSIGTLVWKPDYGSEPWDVYS